MKKTALLIAPILFMMLLSEVQAKTIRVGPTRKLTLPSQAKALAQDGDIIEIDTGIYERDAVNWGAVSELTIRGVGQGRAHLKSEGVCASGKGIWVFEGGRNITIENIEFSGAAVADKNGAGIRFQSTNLTVRNCYFHHNQNGILGGGYHKALDQSEVLVEHSEFSYSGSNLNPPTGLVHNLYIDRIGKFTIRYCFIHHAIIGHNIKSRAKENHIRYNRIGGTTDGRESRSIDIPDAGLSFIIGNVIQQARTSPNRNMLGYALEKGKNSNHKLYVINNTFVSDRRNALFIDIARKTEATVVNNIFCGLRYKVFSGRGSIKHSHNYAIDVSDFVNSAGFDYRLKAPSRAVDGGVKLGAVKDMPLMPMFQYVHPLEKIARISVGNIDSGAYEVYSE